MGVYIKDMKMPKCCGDCHVGFCKQIGCELYIGFDDYATSRHPDCPISNVPTSHGRLIDADAVERNLVKMQMAQKDVVGHGIRKSRAVVRDMPTIIEAEE